MCQSFELYTLQLSMRIVKKGMLAALPFLLFLSLQICIKPSRKMHSKQIAFKFMRCCCLLLARIALLLLLLLLLLISRVYHRQKKLHTSKWHNGTWERMAAVPHDERSWHRQMQIDRSSLVNTRRRNFAEPTGRTSSSAGKGNISKT